MQNRHRLPLVALSFLSITVAAAPAPADTARPAARKASLVKVQPSEAEVTRARAHVATIPGLVRATSEDQVDGPSVIPSVSVARKLPASPKLNVAKFGEAVHGAFKDNVRGYALGLRKNGQPILTLQWDRARTASPALNWSLDTRMHVASVSKLITAIVATKMLDERGLSFDTKIGGYLPAYWNEGQNANDLTFRKLLTHQAAFTVYGGDYPSFKQQIESGVSTNPADGIGYTNGSFSLVRVLTATMTGAVNKNYWFSFPVSPAQEEQLNDAIWDAKTTDAFLAYAQAKVFTPSGVSNAGAVPTVVGAHAFSNKGDNQGWNSGDVSTQLGGAGFRLSVNEVLDVMGTFRRKGTIVSPAKAKESIEARLGIDRIIDTPAGKIYEKNGRWQNGAGPNNDCEQSVAVYLQEDMEVVVFVNSWLPMQASLRNTIRDAYIANLE